MNLVDRVKNILITPKTEWTVIEGETSNLQTLMMTYALPLALIGAVASFIGWGLIGYSYWGSSIAWGLKMGIIYFVSSIGGVLATIFVVDRLSPSFGSEKNINRSAQLVIYSSTPAWVGAVFNILPGLAMLGMLVGLYGIYLIYLGLGPMKKTPEDKKVIYLVITYLVLIVIYFVLLNILYRIFGLGYGVF